MNKQFKRNQKIRIRGRIETVAFQKNECQVFTWESLRNNTWYHPSNVTKIFK